MLRVLDLFAPLDADLTNPVALAERCLRLRAGQVRFARIARRSVDARDKGAVKWSLALDVVLAPDAKPPKGTHFRETPAPAKLELPRANAEKRPLVVGLGPAGLFAAYALALAGARPIVVERGRDVDARERDVCAFWGGGALDAESNVQFGEGGAGAFSDGKLNTGISDPRCAFVLQTLYECGAPEEILTLAKPHVGTDRLPGVVKALRQRIERLGGEVRFRTRLCDIATEDGRVVEAALRRADGETERIAARTLVLCVGHSARDTFEMLKERGAAMERKPFSIGARIEHAQRTINRAQWGAFADHPALGAADYKLSCRLPDGRTAYTFCMCPGGEVVAAASEAGGVVTNGMSRFARDGENANAALLVSVTPDDFGGDDPLAGVRFQRLWERRAYEIGGFRAPAQRVDDFLARRPSRALGDVAPTYRPGVTLASLDECLPGYAADDMRAAIACMDRQIHGFASPGALLTGVETRSSAPLRITRGPDFASTTLAGLYPCGEGAGYAGGILSAAVDGLRCAEAALKAP